MPRYTAEYVAPFVWYVHDMQQRNTSIVAVLDARDDDDPRVEQTLGQQATVMAAALNESPVA